VARTVLHFVSDILREVKGQATALEARQALQNALNFIDSKTNWEFLLKATNLNVEPAYSTGLVSATAGTTSVTGSGTTWSTGWTYKTIRFAARQMPYAVASFGSATSLTLGSVLSGSANIAAGGYTIYQRRYALPTDCEPGRDLFIKGTRGTGVFGEGVIVKQGRMSFETKSDYQYQSGNTSMYSDDEYDETNNLATIRLDPYPTVSGEYYLVYYKKLTVPTLDSSRIMIPEAFEMAVVKLAAAEIKQRNNMQGWLNLQTQAEGLLATLFNRFGASAAYEDQIEIAMDDWNAIYATSSLMYTKGV
jgi:hypothetical protein